MLSFRATRQFKTPMQGKTEGEKGAAEDKMAKERHPLNGHESERTLGGSGGQRSLACCSPRGRKESDMT